MYVRVCVWRWLRDQLFRYSAVSAKEICRERDLPRLHVWVDVCMHRMRVCVCVCDMMVVLEGEWKR